MRKVLIGLLAAAILAVAGFFGFEFYVQHRIEREIDAAFEPIRAAGGKTSHGKVSFDLLGRTVRIADIVSESAAQPPIRVKLASLTVLGVGRPDATTFTADTMEATDLDVDVGIGAEAAWHVSYAYKVPRVVIKDYAGPLGQRETLAGSGSTDYVRAALEQFAAVTATSITAPDVTTKIVIGSGTGEQTIDYTYSNLTLGNIKQGKVATLTVERASFTADLRQPDGTTQKFGGEIASLAGHDLDSGALRAMLDPDRANDDNVARVYRQISLGDYTISIPNGFRMHMDGITIDDVGLRPSKLQLPQLMAMIGAMSSPATTPSPEQARDLLQKAASIYEGVRVGNAAMRGMTMETPQGSMKLAAIRFDLDNGKIGEFALEGFAVNAPQGPVKLARFALRSLDITGLLRLASQVLTPGQAPSSEQMFGLLRLLEGAEIKGFVAPFKATNKQINVDTISLDWGQFVGPIPTRAHLVAKLTAPIDATDPTQRQLIAAGLDTAAIDVDLAAAWAEASGAFVLDPVKFDVGDVLEASARVSLANVPRGLFSPDLPQAMAMAPQIDAGALELTLRDTGGVDLAVAQYARAQSISRDDARRTLVDSIKSSAQANTDIADVLAGAGPKPGMTTGSELARANSVVSGISKRGTQQASTRRMTSLQQARTSAQVRASGRIRVINQTATAFMNLGYQPLTRRGYSLVRTDGYGNVT